MTPAARDRSLGGEGAGAPVDFERFLLLLGRLNYSWTNTESVLIHMIAGLARTDKETAVVLFLTLNTTRARVDLVERLAKLDRVSETERDGVLGLTRQMLRLAGMRNTYNHCIYAFDQRSGDLSAIRMRVADRRNAIKMGETSVLDAETLDRIEGSLQDLARLNTDFWAQIMRYGYPV